MSEAKAGKCAESERLEQNDRREKNWKRWGPYLSERQWGTVREDYSGDGEAWQHFPHEHARSRAYRWGEDGLLGISDRQSRMCFAVALWNGRDPILKERLFGLTNAQGNHGEDVKEYYFYLDSSPTHSYMKALYKYPQARFPYEQLIETNGKRTLLEREYELIDTGVFENNRYFDVQVEYAKDSSEDILARFTIENRGPETARIDVLPTVWFRNTWIWGCRHEGCALKPRMAQTGPTSIQAAHDTLGRYQIHFQPVEAAAPAQLLFTENETNSRKCYGTDSYTPYVKDAFHEYVIEGQSVAVNPDNYGTKAAAWYRLDVPAGGQVTIKIRLHHEDETPSELFGDDFDEVFTRRIAETGEFYQGVIPPEASEAQRQLVRQAYAGLLWSKQFYHYIVKDWLMGDEQVALPPESRWDIRNSDWQHLYAREVMSVPDKWEYPWFAAWDLAFHMLPLAKIDPAFTKRQMILMLREWFMHPNGQIPAYEYDFHDVNPPVHAWACWRIYKLTGKKGERDQGFLASAFQKLLLNFTWWVNQIDHNGDNVFSGGFLGLDNIGLFDRSKPLPTGGHIEQADGTAWMAFYCSTMLSISLELARKDTVYEDMASKFFEHFVHIADAINTIGGKGLWDEEDGFYYDHLHVDDELVPLKVRSLVGLLPIIAVEVIDADVADSLPDFHKRLEWFIKYRHDLARRISYLEEQEGGGRRLLLAIPSREKLRQVLRYMLDESEFLSPFGIRSLSRYHRDHPVTFDAEGETYTVRYLSGESDSWMFGGNSNWRGPVWFPVNYLIVDALERYHYFYGDAFQVECPYGSGNMMNLKEVAQEINVRLTRLFLKDESDCRPCMGEMKQFSGDPAWKDLLLFHEYFDGDTGEGLGASHQTGWTSLIVRAVEKLYKA